jgi:single-strand selective monofunctional uracil DNA glycosylase
MASDVAERLLKAAARLREETAKLTFEPPIAHVYRPLEYAWPVVRRYIETYGASTKEAVLVGMNPGPFGMAQTGVPFGEVAAVRDWMRLDGAIASPDATHPKRPVQGFACTRSEVSGRRLWGAFAQRYPDARAFFARAFVINYCPLLFLDAGGANLTPDKIRGPVRAALEAACDAHLRASIEALAPKHAIGVGQYATQRLARVVGDRVHVATMPHPSPASPQANRGWDALARTALAGAGLRDLL